MEAELFGYHRGAFSGAYTAKPGKIEMADGGTLFLDEIGELPAEMQVKLLRLLQHGEIDKIGSTGPLRVDVHVIAATTRNLQAIIEDGTSARTSTIVLPWFPWSCLRSASAARISPSWFSTSSRA